MPLPGKTAPSANPNSAKQPPAAASKGKSRLPAMPQGGLKKPKTFQYLDLPKEQERGFYLVKLISAEQFSSEKTNLEKLKLEYTVLDTNCTGVRSGTTVSSLHALQGEQSMYFWKEVAPVMITLAGGEVSDESLAAFTEDAEASYTELIAGAMNGTIARVNLRRAMVEAKDKNGNPTGEGKKARVYRDWEPATEEEITKYTTATE